MTWPSRAPVVALLLAQLVAPLAARALAADDARDALRPCTREDLVGTWAMIRLGTARSAQVDRADPYFYPYQRYAFHTDSSMRHLTALARVSPDAQRSFLSEPSTITWTVEKGRLLTRKDRAAAPEIDACQVLLAKVTDPRSSIPGLPGDLLLTHYGEDGQPIARRLLRKIASPGE